MSNVLDLIETAEKLGPPPLPEAIASYEDEERPEVRGQWAIENTTSADWALRRMAECQAEEAEITAQEQAAIESIRRKAERLRERARRGASFFEFKLLQWMEHNRDSIVKGKAKSRTFLHGKVGWRSSTEKLEVEDEAAAAAWLESLPADSPLVRIKRSPDMRALQEHFKSTGEIPAGYRIAPARDNPYVVAEAPSEALAAKEE